MKPSAAFPGTPIPGCKGLWALCEPKDSKIAYDLSGYGHHLTASAAVTRTLGRYGLQVRDTTNVLTGNWLIFDQYPCWAAVLAYPDVSGADFTRCVTQGWSDNSTTRGFVKYYDRKLAWDASPWVVPSQETLGVTVGVSYGANDHRVLLNGAQVGQSTATGTLPASLNGRIAINGYSSNGTVTPGPDWPFAVVAMGSGLVPDFKWLSDDWLSGQFATLRPRPPLLFKPASKTTPTVTIASSQNPAPVGTNVHYTATVTGAGATPTGTVQFYIDGVATGDPITLADGKATL